MKEQKLSFKNMNFYPTQNFNKKRQSGKPIANEIVDPFAFTLHTFRRNHYGNGSAENQQILDCFNNLSSVLEDQRDFNQKEAMRCQKIFRKGESDFSLPKFSSIESGDTSINNSILDDQIIFINQKSRYECDDQYSFNGEETEKDFLHPKNTNNKNKYQNIIQKIDHFLVKDFNEDNTQNLEKSSVKKNHKTVNSFKDQPRKSFNFRKNPQQNSQKLTQILEEESTVREKIDLLSTYAESLQEENKKLQNQLINQQEMTKRLQSLEKEIVEKNIMIHFLSKELSNKDQKQEKRQKFNKQNKLSNMNIQKQRNTVSALNILSKIENHPPKYRASHQIESVNQQINSLKSEAYQNKKELSEGISGDSCHSKKKSNSFMKKIFRKSDGKKQDKSHKKGSVNQGNQSQADYLVEILKEENSILSTKLNILYGDFQQIIDKYNQVLTDKNTCKVKCCQKFSHNFNQQEKSQNCSYQIENENQVALNQIRSILGQINIDQGQRQKFYEETGQQITHDNFDENEENNLFSESDLQKLRKLQRTKSNQRRKITPEINSRNHQTDRTIPIKTEQNYPEHNYIQRSLNFGSNYRFSMYENNQRNQQCGKRFSTFVSNSDQNLGKNEIQREQNQPKSHQRSRIPPKQSKRQNFSQRVNNCAIK